MSTPTMGHCPSTYLPDKQAPWEKEPDVDNHYDVVQSGIGINHFLTRSSSHATT
jgi:hypothetical protein